MRHRVLAARTVSVSFRAAMESAQKHLQVSAEEREEIRGRWRAWALQTLEGYSIDLERLAAAEAQGDGRAEAIAHCREELERAFEMVRTTVGDG